MCSIEMQRKLRYSCIFLFQTRNILPDKCPKYLKSPPEFYIKYSTPNAINGKKCIDVEMHDTWLRCKFVVLKTQIKSTKVIEGIKRLLVHYGAKGFEELRAKAIQQE